MESFNCQLFRQLLQIYTILTIPYKNLTAASKESDNFNYILSSQGMSSLSNHHLIVAGVEVPMDFIVIRNSSGQITHSEGNIVSMFDWLSSAYINTTFDIHPVNTRTSLLDGNGTTLGVVDLLHNGKYDIMTATVLTTSRIQLVDFTHPILYMPVSFLIPTPVSVVNLLSAAKPFQSWVWLGILVGLLATLISLKLITVTSEGKIANNQLFSSKTVLNVVGLLLDKPAGLRGWFNRRLSTRCVIATWSLGALVLTIVYTSLLTAFVTSPNPQPLISSIYELRYRQDVRLVTNKNRNAEALFLAAEKGFFRVLGNRLRADEESRCLTSGQCVKMVKDGHAVYPAVRDGILLSAMRDDFRTTNKCNVEMGKENFMELQVSWAVQKNSSFRNTLNKSFMRMREVGLISKWSQENTPKVPECHGPGRRGSEKVEGRVKLSLKTLSAGFVLLLVSYLISLMALLVEILYRTTSKLDFI